MSTWECNLYLVNTVNFSLFLFAVAYTRMYMVLILYSNERFFVAVANRARYIISNEFAFLIVFIHGLDRAGPIWLGWYKIDGKIVKNRRFWFLATLPALFSFYNLRVTYYRTYHVNESKINGKINETRFQQQKYREIYRLCNVLTRREYSLISIKKKFTKIPWFKK